MLKGTVVFAAPVIGNQIAFPQMEVAPLDPAIAVIELETSYDTGEIRVTAHFEAVETADNAEAIAARVVTTYLDRISFRHALAIGNPRRTQRAFTSLEPNTLAADVGELALVGEGVTFCIGLSESGVNSLRAALEQASLPGERWFRAYRLARQAEGVEGFLQLYQLLLMLRGDSQGSVDEFIRSKMPSVPQTPSPRNRAIMETVYTRLRNEFAHVRAGVDLEQTKSEMRSRVGELSDLTRQAIQESP